MSASALITATKSHNERSKINVHFNIPNNHNKQSENISSLNTTNETVSLHRLINMQQLSIRRAD